MVLARLIELPLSPVPRVMRRLSIAIDQAVFKGLGCPTHPRMFDNTGRAKSGRLRFRDVSPILFVFTADVFEHIAVRHEIQVRLETEWTRVVF